MATRPIYATLVAALGGFGPRARAYAFEGPELEIVGEGRGLGEFNFFDFIPEALKAVGGIAQEVPAIMAASGMKSAKEQQQLVAALKRQELEVRLAETKGTEIGAWAPWAALGAVGLGGLALAFALARLA